MSVRVKMLQRLATLYGIVEELRALERERAAMAVFVTERATTQQISVAQQALQSSRVALVSSDRHDALLHESEREVARFNTEQLTVQQREYERLEREAAEHHRLALLQQDQIDTIVQKIGLQDARQNSRREQALSDDRFSARAYWLSARERRRLKNS